MFFKRFLNPTADAKIAREMYGQIVAKARQPYFYETLGVPDTVDGRFDIIVLHAVLVMERLAKAGRAGSALAQKLFDAMFADMDSSLREMGAGDLSVGKKVRRMAEVFYGRARAYRETLDVRDEPALATALLRNVYAGETPSDKAGRLARYVLASAQMLDTLSEADLAAGRLAFPDPRRIVEP
jgi:cytochrome b pre-mRNA-processing protein 3